MNADNTDFLKRIGLVTCQKYLDMTPDEQALRLTLAELGIEAVAVAWDDKQVDWTGYDGLLVRTIWNYHEQPTAFRSWLAEIEQVGVPVWNSVPTIRWNMEKTYLRELADRGVAVVPTVWLEKGEVPVLSQILAKQGWTEAVVKPVISASAIDSWLTASTTSTTSVSSVTASTGSANAVTDQPRFEELLARKALMVQQKMPIEQGEWSLIFLGGEYSHGVLKRPAEGDFRVQDEYGGSFALLEPSPSLVAQARQILETVPGTLYARVDGMDINGRFVLMELELIEPYLFLELAVGGVERFAEKLIQIING